MKKNKIIVYLVELIHSEYGLSLLTVPLGIGVVGSYCKSIHKENIELKLFRTLDDLMNAVKKQKPDIIGFAYFSWNDGLTLVASKMVRQISQDIVIVYGGSGIIKELEDPVLKPGKDRGDLEKELNVSLTPYNNYHFLKENDEIDFIVYGDGEIPFSNIITELVSGKNREELRKISIDGCMSFMHDQVVSGKAVEIIYDLDVIPSPYITGLFSKFLKGFKLMPQIETIRGCPFQCTFCTIGGLSPKLRRHSLEYIREEITYLKEHSPNKILRISDPNWGIVEQDIDVARFIKELHDTAGYPSSLRVYYSAKGPMRNVKTMAKMMKDLLPLNMSFQTLNKESLKNIKRSNLSDERIREMRIFGNENGLATSTELISGLPGESYESFRKGFFKTIKLGIDSIYINALYLIKGSELDTNEARVKHKIRTAFILIGKDVTKIDGRYIFEKDEMVVASNAMSKEDYWKLHKFRLFAQLSYAAAFLKEIIMHCLNYEITPLDLFDELMADSKKYPFYNKIFSGYIEQIKSIHFDTPLELEKSIEEHLEKKGDIGVFDIHKKMTYTMGKVLSMTEKQLFIAEVIKSATNLYEKRNEQVGGEGKVFLDGLSILENITPLLIISPCEEGLKKEVIFESHYDIFEWAQNNYKKPLIDHYSSTLKSFILSVRNIDEHKDVLKIIKDSNWKQDEKFYFYFTTIVSSNLRRLIYK
ncbi:hypothetical protein MNBD_GAMMA03-464 [hydrothermal vent metagenome]|uniref:Uncharacterized protein n=1 Tax=hydrothermal vent metagenome TaxID=652676 RepID=A0A3B0W8X2_9ZZZZ